MKHLLVFSFLWSVSSVFAQNVREEVSRVADHIVANTSFEIIHSETGQRYTSTAGLELSPSIKVESPYNEWKYWNGVLTLGMFRLAEVLDDQQYQEYSLKNYAFIFDNLDYFEKQYAQKIKKSSFYLYFRMSRLDDCGAMAAGLCEVQQLNPKPEYQQYLERTAKFIKEEEVRLDDRTIVRPKPREMTLWADDLYMSVPFLARMYKQTGDDSYLNDAVLLVKNFYKYLYRPTNGLYYHSWYNDTKQNGVAHWGRCNGWVAMAHAELLSFLPADHPDREELIRIFESHILGIGRHQDISGLWHQVLDRPDSYLESSATAMFVYAVARGINEGWINASYAGIATRGWKGLAGKITKDGQVEDICIGTGIEDNLAFYYERPTLLNDIHGLGAVLLAGAEVIKLEQLLEELAAIKKQKKLLRSKNQ